MADKFPVTKAIRVLREKKGLYQEHLYTYEEKGGTRASTKALGVPENQVIKTIILEDEGGKGHVVLMHGNKEVSTKTLARILGCKSLIPAAPERAQILSGYLVGGTSPFGLKNPLPLYLEKTILDLPLIYINGGKRGFLISMNPSEVLRILNPIIVETAAE